MWKDDVLVFVVLDIDIELDIYENMMTYWMRTGLVYIEDTVPICMNMNLCKLVCKYGGSSYIRLRLADEIAC